jgi:hypothetical protein
VPTVPRPASESWSAVLECGEWRTVGSASAGAMTHPTPRRRNSRRLPDLPMALIPALLPTSGTP